MQPALSNNELISVARDQPDKDVDLAGGGEEKDLSPVLSNIRHITQTLSNTEQLDQACVQYAAGKDATLTAAAWIASEMRKHLTGLSDFCDALGTGGDGYLVKKRRTGAP